jgi:hypothetical protein
VIEITVDMNAKEALKLWLVVCIVSIYGCY